MNRTSFDFPKVPGFFWAIWGIQVLLGVALVGGVIYGIDAAVDYLRAHS